MLRAPRKRPSSGWPFWLMIVAWLCANTPQNSVYEFLGWLSQARHFSHQQRLQTEVAQVLHGKARAPLWVAQKNLPVRPLLPAVPTDPGLKKIELATESSSELLPPPTLVVMYSALNPRRPENFRAEPPHEPPRADRIA